jgi:hypothetical protein
VGWDDGSRRHLLASITGYETALSNAVTSLQLTNGSLTSEAAAVPGINHASTLALGYLPGPRPWTLFVGGGVVPGRYPLGAPSHLLVHNGRQWVLDSRNSAGLVNLGIVNGAVWSDLDGNGVPELILACEWGPIRVFQNRGGLFAEITRELGLDRHTGWWRGVTAGDLNGDGRMDLIASNWGLNSPYRASDSKPLTFFHGELAQPGVFDLIETEYDGDALVPSRQLMPLANSLPFLLDRVQTHTAYSEATLDTLLGDRKVLGRASTCVTLASTLFLNLATGFQPAALPREAQLAPAFSVNVADADGDGREDVFLSQNFFDLQPEVARIDAGTGLWLRGRGDGTLQAIPLTESGLRVDGEQRGAALADYDADGRIDIAVSQNGAATRLFHNIGARPGLRVRLQGPPDNPAGIGAVLRLQFKDHQGPAREIHAGSGYASQDSSLQVLGVPEPPKALWIRWPGGRITTTPLDRDVREITVNLDGTAKPHAP